MQISGIQTLYEVDPLKCIRLVSLRVGIQRPLSIPWVSVLPEDRVVET